MSSAGAYDLDRFMQAQESDGTYQKALTELRRGRKTTHWMWFVFPQIAGLGSSPTSQLYAIASLEEARAYLAHPVLGARLHECASAIAGLAESDAASVLGGIDAQKLRSSMTLFLRAAPEDDVFAKVLGKFFDGVTDSRTDSRLSDI